MKLPILISILLGALIVYACNKESSTLPQQANTTLENDQKNNFSTNQASEKLNLLLSEAGWFPEESSVEQLSNGHVSITAPSEWIYIGSDDNGNIHAISGGGIDISCTCSEGKGCDPYIKGGKHCCNMKNGCTACSKKVEKSGIIIGTDEQISFTVKKGGYINLEEGIHFEETDTERPMAFAEMFNEPMITEALEVFYQENGLAALIDHQKVEGEEYYHTAINIFGRRGILEIPESLFDDDDSILLALAGDAGSYTCDCSEGSCTFEKIMGIKYCSSDDCSGTCTLSSSIVIGEETQAKAENVYKY